MQKTKNRWSIPPAAAAQKPEAHIEPIAVRSKVAAVMLGVSSVKFLSFTVPYGGTIPAIQPLGKGTTKLFLVSDLLSYLTGERDKARAALTPTSADASP